MTHAEYKEILNYELYRFSNNKTPNFVQKLRIKYVQPNTNCMYMARKMWYLQQRGGFHKIRAKLIYLRIIRKYACIIFPDAVVGRGFHITHPTGIVLGHCRAGENFMIYQNCSVGAKKPGDNEPMIGNNVELSTNSVVLGHIHIADNVLIGANSLVNKDITESGVYVGSPVRKIRDI